MKKLNQRGFSPATILLLLLLILLLAIIGWWVNNQNSQPATDTSSQSSGQTAEPAEQQTAKFLDIKEFGVKLPLSSDIEGLYYQVRPKTDGDPAQYVEIFDKKFDETKNSKGTACKDENFPLFVIGRVEKAKLNEVAEQDKAGYKEYPFSSEYLFVGSAAKQAYPACAYIDDNNETDKTIISTLEKIQESIGAGYKNIQKL